MTIEKSKMENEKQYARLALIVVSAIYRKMSVRKMICRYFSDNHFSVERVSVAETTINACQIYLFCRRTYVGNFPGTPQSWTDGNIIEELHPGWEKL